MSWNNVIPAWMLFDFPKHAPKHVKEMLVQKHTKKVLVSKHINKDRKAPKTRKVDGLQ